MVMCHSATRKTTSPKHRHSVVIAALAPSGTERVEQLAIGECGEKILDRLERRIVFEAVPSEQGFGRVDDHHGRLTQGLRGDTSSHDNYYTTNPRNVGGMVEKSEKKPFCDAKCGKIRAFLGERVLDGNDRVFGITSERVVSTTPGVFFPV